MHTEAQQTIVNLGLTEPLFSQARWIIHCKGGRLWNGSRCAGEGVLQCPGPQESQVTCQMDGHWEPADAEVHNQVRCGEQHVTSTNGFNLGFVIWSSQHSFILSVTVVVFWGFNVGDAHTRSQSVSWSWPIWHHTLPSKGPTASSATVLSRSIVSFSIFLQYVFTLQLTQLIKIVGLK